MNMSIILCYGVMILFYRMLYEMATPNLWSLTKSLDLWRVVVVKNLQNWSQADVDNAVDTAIFFGDSGRFALDLFAFADAVAVESTVTGFAFHVVGYGHVDFDGVLRSKIKGRNDGGVAVDVSKGGFPGLCDVISSTSANMGFMIDREAGFIVVWINPIIFVSDEVGLRFRLGYSSLFDDDAHDAFQIVSVEPLFESLLSRFEQFVHEVVDFDVNFFGKSVGCKGYAKPVEFNGGIVIRHGYQLLIIGF